LQSPSASTPIKEAAAYLITLGAPFRGERHLGWFTALMILFKQRFDITKMSFYKGGTGRKSAIYVL
jgi:hypothetical protein